MEILPWLQKIILGAGGLLVIYIGVGLIRSKADLSGGKDVNQPLWKTIGSAFIVTWLNPQALIDGTLMLGAFRASLPTGSDSYFITGFFYYRLCFCQLSLVQRSGHYGTSAWQQDQ